MSSAKIEKPRVNIRDQSTDFQKTRSSNNGNDGSSSISSNSIATINSNMLYSSTYVVKVQTTYKARPAGTSHLLAVYSFCHSVG